MLVQYDLFKTPNLARSRKNIVETALCRVPRYFGYGKGITFYSWTSDQFSQYRRRLNRQINKGEALHSLRSHLCYANQGEIREQQDEQLHNQVGCLNLVTNAVIVWNSVYIEKVVQQLKQEGQFPGDEELKHIWPTRHAHINVYGRYHFNQEQVGKKQQLRELRQPGFQP